MGRPPATAADGACPVAHGSQRVWRRLGARCPEADALRGELEAASQEIAGLRAALEEERRIRGRGCAGSGHPFVALGWSDVSGFFRAQCVTGGGREIAWYREAWTALGNAGLLGTSCHADAAHAQAVLKLRALCLAVMYLGLYEAACGSGIGQGAHFGERHSLWWYLGELEVDDDVLVDIARSEGYFELVVLEEGHSEHDELWATSEFVEEAMRSDCPVMFRALEDHFGGDIGLFTAIWNSRLDPEDKEPPDVAVNSTEWGDGKVAVWQYVSEGMRGWTMPPAGWGP